MLAYSYLLKPQIFHGEKGVMAIINGRAAPVLISQIINRTGRNDIQLALVDGETGPLGSKPYKLGRRIKPHEELAVKFAADEVAPASFRLERIGWRLWETIPAFNLIILPGRQKRQKPDPPKE